MVDTDRRTMPARAVGRVLSGQDRYEKEAREGDPASPLAAARRERMAALSRPVEGKASFAERLKQLGSKPDKR